ncbi:KNOP1 protein, partial [Tricholaema leucomelas]|nr:KNOP1 protein [Tricholaema leucomelas]
LPQRRADGAKRKSRKKAALSWDGEAAKKKKKKGVFSFSLEGIQDSKQKQSENVCAKPHKRTAWEKAFMDHSCAAATIQNDGERHERRKKRKKNKDKSDFISALADNQESISRVPCGTIKLSDFRERQRTLAHREKEDTAENSRSSREARRKKKRSKDVSSVTYEDNPEYRHKGAGKHLPAQHEVESEEKELSGKKSRKNIKVDQVIKEKKKMQKEEEEKEMTKVYLANHSASKTQKVTVLESYKKNKESETKPAKCVTGDTVEGALCKSNHLLCDRKGRKRRKAAAQDCPEEPGSNASIKKLKKEAEENEALEHMDDVTIVQEKKGNCDEVKIDKVRRQALQEEIDRESGKTKTKLFPPKVGQNPILGQWSTATFESSEKQMKFFRLMGGFKKGSSVPIQPLSATTDKANMALNKEGEEKLQQTLKMEFDKAMNWKQHRGVGLGFQPAANKQVYIDKYTTRSIKFED